MAKSPITLRGKAKKCFTTVVGRLSAGRGKKRGTDEMEAPDDTGSVNSYDSTGMAKGNDVPYAVYEKARKQGKQARVEANFYYEVAPKVEVNGETLCVAPGPCEINQGDLVIWKNGKKDVVCRVVSVDGNKVYVTTLAEDKKHKPLLTSLKKLIRKPAAPKEEGEEEDDEAEA